MANERNLFLFLFAAVFSVYAYCAYPTIAPRDSADLASAAYSMGVAHPPGYPLYMLLGKAWIGGLGMANPAYRLNLLSAACGALAVLTVFAVLLRSCGRWPALAGAAAFALSSSLWKFSLLEEKYSIQALFAGALLFLAMEKDDRRFLLSALLFGLGLVNHQTLILLAPALAYLWRGRRPNAAAGLLLLAGLSLNAAVWLRLKDAPLAWAVLTRADYGSLTLSSNFARPMSPALAWGLLSHFLTGLVSVVTWPVALLACLGVVELRKTQEGFAVGLALTFLAFGPVYFLLTRFDLSSWAARSVLEPAFIVPSLVVCLAAGFGARRLGPAAAVAVIVLGAGSHYAEACRREDFSAHDYAKDLRRFIPPGGAAVVAGDTALFGLKYLEGLQPEGVPHRAILGSVESEKRLWLERRLAAEPVYVAGLSEEALHELGLLGNPRFLKPEGPVQEVSGAPAAGSGASWEMSVLRPAPGQDSYARDVKFSYAYARFLTGRLNEFYHRPAERDFQHAALLEPETYRLERVVQ